MYSYACDVNHIFYVVLRSSFHTVDMEIGRCDCQANRCEQAGWFLTHRKVAQLSSLRGEYFGPEFGQKLNGDRKSTMKVTNLKHVS